MIHRLTAWCLMLVLLFGLLPAGALATGGEQPTQTEAAYAWEELSLDEIPETTPEEDPMYLKNMGGDDPQTSSVRASANKMFSDFTPRETDGETVRYGIDVSTWQGDIDWSAVAEAGVEFVFVRLGARGWGQPGTLMKDGDYVRNIQGAKENGILVGAYFYTQATTVEEAEEEAAFSMKLLEDAGLTLDLPLVYDFEYAYGTSGYTGRLYNADLTWQEQTELCHAFCDAVEAGGYSSMVYANYTMFRNELAPSQFDSVWLAHYTQSTWYSGHYEYWQCSQEGYINGISGPVDLNFWYDPSGAEERMDFDDVSVGHWFYRSVEWAYENGVVNGMSETAFAPGDYATRAHVITMLYRLDECPEVVGETPFEDLTQNYYKNAVLWAVQNGVTNGISATEFGPDRYILRQDMITMLYRMAGSPEVSGDLSGFSDEADVKDYAYDAMVWAVENGIIEGYTDNTLRPNNNTTRAEVCTILRRIEMR